MAPNLISRKSSGDEIDKYLDKVFGGFPTPGEVDAEKWQERLGVEVSLDDLDLIYTLQATEEEDIAFSHETPPTTKSRMETRLFLDAIRDMRVEMERRLRTAAAEIEAQGSADFVAIQKTMARTTDANDLRDKVIASAAHYCRQKTLENVPNIDFFDSNVGKKIGSTTLWQLFQVFGRSFLFGPIIILEQELHLYLQHTLLDYVAIAFVLGIGISFGFSSTVANALLLSNAKSFFAKSPLPHVTVKQRFRFFWFKLWKSPFPQSQFSAVSCIYLAAMTFGFALHTTHYHLDIATVWIGVISGMYFGKRLWRRIRTPRAIVTA